MHCFYYNELIAYGELRDIDQFITFLGDSNGGLDFNLILPLTARKECGCRITECKCKCEECGRQLDECECQGADNSKIYQADEAYMFEVWGSGTNAEFVSPKMYTYEDNVFAHVQYVTFLGTAPRIREALSEMFPKLTFLQSAQKDRGDETIEIYRQSPDGEATFELCVLVNPRGERLSHTVVTPEHGIVFKGNTDDLDDYLAECVCHRETVQVANEFILELLDNDPLAAAFYVLGFKMERLVTSRQLSA